MTVIILEELRNFIKPKKKNSNLRLFLNEKRGRKQNLKRASLFAKIFFI